MSGTVTRREEAKAQRRQRILASAEELIRRRGDTEFSMRELADHAGVAFATPFNLFESKEQLLLRLFADRIWPRQASLAAAPADGDPIDHVIHFASAAFATYIGDAALFHPLVRVVISSAASSQGRATFDAATDLWRGCLEPARAQGLLRAEAASGGQLERALHLVFRGALVSWVPNDASVQAIERDLIFSVKTLLAGAVVDSERSQPLARIRS